MILTAQLNCWQHGLERSDYACACPITGERRCVQSFPAEPWLCW
jgi:hypothetical protein